MSSAGGSSKSDVVQNASGYAASNPILRFSSGPVRYADGAVKLSTDDLSSSGFGMPWGQTRSWSNTTSVSVPNTVGTGWIVTDSPYINQVTGDNGTTLVIVSNGVNARDFDVNGSTYTEHYFLQDKLTHSGTQYTLTDTTGNQIVFWDFSVALSSQKGAFQSFTDPDGNTVSVTSRGSSGQPTEIQRSVTVGGTTTIESLLYTWNGSPGQITSVVLRRKVGTGSWTTIRQAVYTYYASMEAHGNVGDLKLAQIKDANGNVLDTKYYRYFTTGDTGGYLHSLRFVFNAQSYARLVAALGTNVSSLSDSQVLPYCDNYFEYDSNQRVTKEIAQGQGCSSCSGGQGTYLFAYATSTSANGYNNWKYKTTETLPDGNENIVYTNFAGEVMLNVFHDTTANLKWDTFFKYDSLGRPILEAMPSAVTGYDDTKADLLNSVSGNYQYLSDSTGLVQIVDYGTSTTATSSTPGDVIGYLKDTKVQQGELGTAIKTGQQQYYSNTASSVTIYPQANSTVYRNTDGTGAETTSFSYTFFTGTNQIQSITTTLPVISSGENGPGTADTQITFFDTYARPIWTKDGDGFINYTAYDPVTGAVTKTITDVDTTHTGDFQNLPSGWSTPSGGGLHLITSFVVDGLGRATQVTDPNGNITYRVFIDTNYEVRTYPGWTGSATTGPTQDVREDRVSSYYETLTMSATPHTTGGVPDGTEAISNVQTLSRQYMSAGGQIVRNDAYFNLTGVTYSVSAYIGTQNTNYYTTNYGYDDRGRKDRTQTPNGTIYRTFYDGLGRVVSTWIGTNDTPGNGQEWEPTNNTSPSNMIQITGNVYDTGTAPSAPTLSQISGGTLPATTYYVKVAYVFGGPAGPGSAESSLAVTANHLLQVSSPASVAGATGYNVYVATSTGNESMQNSSPIAIGTSWTEPTSGLISTKEAPFTNAVGDGDLTQVTQIPGGSAANRVTQYFFDWRDRLVATKSGVQGTEDTTTHRPIMHYTLDNLGEQTAVDQYDVDGITITTSNGLPQAPSSSLLRAHSLYSYDEQGRDYLRQVFSVDQTNGTVSTNSLNSNTYRDHRGNIIKGAGPGGLVYKFVFDGAGRQTKSYVTDGGGDTTWSDAGNVIGDAVLTETITAYDSDSNTMLVTTKKRFHDETATGELGDPNSAPKSRNSYVASYYDAANRLTTSVDVGTNGGSAYTRPSSPPSPSDTVLVTSYAFTAAGFVDTITDPRGIVQKNYSDNLGRVTKTIQDYTDGTPTNNTNKTTEYTFDGNGHTITIQADMPAGAHETTQYVYGVTVTGGSNVYSNDMLSAVQYPDPTTGNPSSSQQVSYTVNALGQSLTMTDRNGNVHSYSYDVLSRPTADAVTTLGTGVDGSVRRIETAYDTGGRPYLFTSFDAASGGNIVNQVEEAYNGLGQQTEEWQSHSGAVNTSTTPNVQYSYTLMSGGVNNSRLTSMTYPNGRVISYNYATGLDDTISRLTSISDSGVTLDSLSYLGLDTVVKEAHPQPGVDLTYIKQTGESNGDAGDQYTGLDRFGRVVDQRWIITSTGTALDRTQYGYDRDGNVLYSNNLVNASFSELYHANGSGNDYDNLNQLTNFARGTLNGSNDTISSPSHSIAYSFDALGNWTSVVTDGSSTQTRTANQQNEITSISGQTTPTYDPNGNMTGDQSGHTLIFDAWNRLVQMKNAGTIIQAYSYDALSRRITENPGTLRDLFYSSKWQLLEEDVAGSIQYQYVWSPVYVDVLIERDTSTLRVYVQHNLNYDITSLISTSAAVLERYIYDPFGQPTILAADWSFRGTSSYGWVFLHQGSRFDNVTGLYYFRNRDFSPTLGRWIRNDPAGYGAGDINLYRDESNDPVNQLDPYGLKGWPSWLSPPDYTKPPGMGNPLGPGDLIVLGCSQPDWVVDYKATCKNQGFTIGPYSSLPQCAGDFKSLCGILKYSCERRGRKYDRITLVGHCGGQTKPGAMLSPGNLFNSFTLTNEVIKCIQDALPPGGVLTLCTCGYRVIWRPIGGGLWAPFNWQIWDDSLQNLANKLHRKVCACPGPAGADNNFGCRCENGAGQEVAPVCKSPNNSK